MGDAPSWRAGEVKIGLTENGAYADVCFPDGSNDWLEFSTVPAPRVRLDPDELDHLAACAMNAAASCRFARAQMAPRAKPIFEPGDRVRFTPDGDDGIPYHVVRYHNVGDEYTYDLRPADGAPAMIHEREIDLKTA